MEWAKKKKKEKRKKKTMAIKKEEEKKSKEKDQNEERPGWCGTERKKLWKAGRKEDLKGIDLARPLSGSTFFLVLNTKLLVPPTAPSVSMFLALRVRMRVLTNSLGCRSSYLLFACRLVFHNIYLSLISKVVFTPVCTTITEIYTYTKSSEYLPTWDANSDKSLWMECRPWHHSCIGCRPLRELMFLAGCRPLLKYFSGSWTPSTRQPWIMRT